MEQIMNYIKPELIVAAVALYFIGMWLKQAAFIKNKYIPLIIGVIAVLLCSIWVLATCTLSTGQDVAQIGRASCRERVCQYV